MNYDIKIDEYGTKRYYENNRLSRDDGPACEYDNGDKVWYKNGVLHREDGPAVELTNGDKYWWLNNKCYGINNEFTNESWNVFVKTLIFS